MSNYYATKVKKFHYFDNLKVFLCHEYTNKNICAFVAFFNSKNILIYFI